MGNWIKVTVIYEAEEPAIAKDLIADTFFGLGLPGIEIHEPEKDSGEDWADDALPLPGHYSVTGYLPQARNWQERLLRLQEALSQRARTGNFSWKLTTSITAEQDWADAWKKHFHPVRITGRIVVKPSWEEYRPESDDIIIEIDPGMAFGTGTHPTTSMCIQMIEKYMSPGARVLDIGTGSGILLVASALLGASSGLGTDSDPVAVEVALKNLAKNRIPQDRFRVIHKEGCPEGEDSSYDIIVANILYDPVRRLLPGMKRALKPGGLIIASGITEGARQDICDAFELHGLETIQIASKEGWITACARKT